MAAKQETAEALAPAERRDRARSRAAEVAAKVQVLDAQLADVAAREQQLDLRQRGAEGAVKQAWGTVSGSRSALSRAKASALIDESTGAPKVAAALAALGEAEELLGKAKAAAESLTATVGSQRQELADRRADLQSQRDELAGLASALKTHAAEAHHDAGREALAEAKATKRQLLERISAARSELAAAEAALDLLHHETAARIQVDHPELTADLQVEGVIDPRHAARDILSAFSFYLDALERHAGRLSVQQSGMLPYGLVPAYYMTQEVVRSILRGNVGQLVLLRQPAAKALADLGAAEATAARVALKRGA